MAFKVSQIFILCSVDSGLIKYETRNGQYNYEAFPLVFICLYEYSICYSNITLLQYSKKVQKSLTFCQFKSSALFQALNQTYNYFVNVFQGQAEAEPDWATLFSAIFISLTTAMSGKFFIEKTFPVYSQGYFIKRVQKKNENNGFQIPGLIGVSSANLVNLFYARLMKEDKGINVYDAKTGEKLGDMKSKIASQRSFWMCAISHMVLPIPVIYTPVVITYYLRTKNLMPSSKYGKGVINLLASSIGLIYGLPLTMGFFPQMIIMEKKHLEPEFHNLRNKSGEEITFVKFNKGT